MRKKTIKNVADTVFWYSLYMLPLIIVVVMMFQCLGSDIYQTEYYAVVGNPGDIIITTFNWCCDILFEWISYIGMFDGFADIFYDVGLAIDSALFWFVFDYLIYFVVVYLLHVCIDFLLFIPRLAHKWMNAFTRED